VQQGVGNLEAVELGLREALFNDGRRMLQQLLNDSHLSLAQNETQCGEKCHAQRRKAVETLFGTIELQRPYFYCPASGHGRAPLDKALGLVDGYSPGLVRLGCRAAARSGYAAASEDLQELAAITLDGRQIQRLVNKIGPAIGEQLQKSTAAPPGDPIPVVYVEVDGTGVPMVADELAGRKGKQADGSSTTREAKLGAVFTQTKTDEEGLPVRDFESTSYVGSFDSAEAFGLRVRQESQRRGIARAGKIVFLGDGAAWIWELARLNFPLAVLILDFYHAAERLHQLCAGLYGQDSSAAKGQEQKWREMMLDDQIEQVIAAAHRRLDKLGSAADPQLAKQIGYFENNQNKMKYKTYRKAGYFYGSGVVEAGCKVVIGQRLKNSGMFWTESGAQNILNLRCALLSHRWEECWNQISGPNHFELKAVA
jgi:hypothetical protein